ncbi:MAG: ATP-binding protein, partial [Chloroflexota bacterium]
LASWGQSGERIQRLRDAAEFVIYTPGSSAGLPVSILKSFAAPGPELLDDADLMRERVSTTVTSLLGLLGIAADPIQSREHILLSNLVDAAWRQGQDLDLARLIQQVQSPPMSKIGVLDLESFYPSKERFGLMMALNNLLASPGFGAWLEGEALDIGQILYTPQGKPRVAIFSIAHLGDPERMFFVSLLLNQILGWMRAQPGTTSLRTLVYMDEIFGYLPPTANPPAKQPLLTLLKQARAYGVGIVLATQNPVDLDYKGLGNTGTWFIGRLQTERDKARLLDGLEGAMASSSSQFDRRTVDQTLSGLGSRVFLMNNVHEDAPVLFQTRWAMSYLCGPLTRDQIRTLMAAHKAQAQRTAAQSAAPAQKSTPSQAAAPQPAYQPAAVAAPRPAPAAQAAASAGQQPVLSGIDQYFLPFRGRAPVGGGLLYRPQLIGAARVHIVNAKANVDLTEDLLAMTPITDDPIPVDWERGEETEIELGDLLKAPEGPSQYAPLPAMATRSASYTTWSRGFSTWVYQNHKQALWRSPSTGSLSRPGESERDFRIRLHQSAREERDAAVEKLRQKYASKITTLQERKRRAEQTVDVQRAQARQQKAQAAISVGATILSVLTGRKVTSASSVGRATTAVRGFSRSAQEQSDVARAEETVEAVQQMLTQLEGELKAQTTELQARMDPLNETLETVDLRP